MSRSQPLSTMPSQLFQPSSQVGMQPVDVLHVVLPCGFEHASLQERQLAVVPSWVSQAGAPATHSAKPMAQVVAVHMPPPHVSLEFGMSHDVPQAPQSVRLVVGVSQPLLGLPSQSPQPIEQVGTQPPVVQACVPCSFAQSAQPRQLSRVPSCVSQPSCSSEQSAKPAVHPVNSHMPPRHSAEPFGMKHELSHLPQ